MTTYSVEIWNAGAEERAYSENRRPREGEAKRTLVVRASGISGINARVQEEMVEAGFARSEWKVLGHTP